MHPATYVCTHISVHKIIIEDNKLVCNQSSKYFTIAKNNHYSNIDIDTIDHGKIIDCTTHHICQDIIVGMMSKCCRWWWRGASPRGRGGGHYARGQEGWGARSPATATKGGGPWGAVAPWPSSSLDQLGTVEDPSPLEMAAKGEENSQLWVVPPKNRVSDQYIVLEASPGPSDQTLGSKGSWEPLEPSWWLLERPISLQIRGLAELISYGKSLSQPRHQLSESRNCFCTLQKSGHNWSIRTPF
jgi:hypothetical protein